jgi:hypothetical protein
MGAGKPAPRVDIMGAFMALKSIDGQPRPGEFARRWLCDLAESHGGFLALASAAGLTQHWAWTRARGVVPVPREATVLALSQTCGVADEILQAVLDDARAFRQDPKPTCSCGRSISLGNARKVKSFDPETLTFLCRACSSHRGETMRVVCPECGQARDLSWYRRKSRQQVVGPDGQVKVRCVRCTAQRSIQRAQRIHTELILGERAVSIGRRGAETDGDRLFVTYSSAHRLKLRDVPRYMLAHRADADAAAAIRTLKGEDLFRQVGAGNVQAGRKSVADLVLANRYSGPHPGKSRTSVVSARLTGAFYLCPLCGLLVYRRANSITPSGHVWHRPCLFAWEWTPDGHRWMSGRRAAKAQGIPSEALDPFPMPPPLFPKGGAPVSGALLMAGYGALLQWRNGASVAQLAREAGTARQSMQDRLAGIQARLPACWELVFQSTTGGLDARQRLHPLPNIGSGQRGAAQRMTGLGIPANVIEQVTGVRPEAV